MSFDEIMRKAVAEEIERQQQKAERLPIPIAKILQGYKHITRNDVATRKRRHSKIDSHR